MREIGSEFEYQHFPKLVNQKMNFQDFSPVYSLSGRSALDLVIHHILLKRRIERVLLPSYCCQSIIQPFLNNNIKVEFYNVNWDSHNGFLVDSLHPGDHDIVLVLSYFGFSGNYNRNIIRQALQKNSIIINDKTHSYLSKHSEDEQYDYGIASLRKWFPIASGGIAWAFEKGDILEQPSIYPKYGWVDKKWSAMKMKTYYLETQIKNESIKRNSQIASASWTPRGR